MIDASAGRWIPSTPSTLVSGEGAVISKETSESPLGASVGASVGLTPEDIVADEVKGEFAAAQRKSAFIASRHNNSVPLPEFTGTGGRSQAAPSKIDIIRDDLIDYKRLASAVLMNAVVDAQIVSGPPRRLAEALIAKQFLLGDGEENLTMLKMWSEVAGWHWKAIVRYARSKGYHQEGGVRMRLEVR